MFHRKYKILHFDAIYFFQSAAVPIDFLGDLFHC